MITQRAAYPVGELFKWDVRTLIIVPVLAVTIYLVMIPLAFLLDEFSHRSARHAFSTNLVNLCAGV